MPPVSKQALFMIGPLAQCHSNGVFLVGTWWDTLYMGHDARKPVFGVLRITQAQTSLRIRAV